MRKNFALYSAATLVLVPATPGEVEQHQRDKQARLEQFIEDYDKGDDYRYGGEGRSSW